MCPIMPERLARTDPFKQVTEMVGSGPFRFKADERVPGSRVVYERFDGYVPRAGGTPDWTAGPKVVHFDRVEWHVIPDAATAAGALQRGEVDWWERRCRPAAALRATPACRCVQDPTGLIGIHAAEPPAAAVRQPGAPPRRAGRRGAGRLHAGGRRAPANVAGRRRRVLPRHPAGERRRHGGDRPRDLARASAAVAAAGYRGERVVVLGASDIASSRATSDVGQDLLKRLGLNVDYQTSDWGTIVQRRAKMDPVEAGGWSVYHTYWSGLDQFTPATHAFLRGNGRGAGPGWPSSPALEALRAQWFAAPDLAAQQAVAAQMQLQAFADVPYIPLGQHLPSTAFRSRVQGVLKGLPVFWNVTV